MKEVGEGQLVGGVEVGGPKVRRQPVFVSRQQGGMQG